MKRIKVGLVSALQPSFWGSKEKRFDNHYAPRLLAIAQELGFELYIVKTQLIARKDAEQACKEIADQGIDFLLVQLSTFAGGDVIAPLAESGIRIGIWGIPELTEDGPIPLNSFCGINMHMSIIGQYMDRGIKTKWFYGDVDDELFQERFKITVRALTAIKNLQGARVGLIGGIAPGFNNLYYDERKTKRKLDVTVDRFQEFADVKSRALSYRDDEIADTVAAMQREACCVTESTQKYMHASARVYRAIEDLIRDNGFDAVAIGCWPRFRKELGMVPCSVIGRLLDHGYIAACEGDVDSAISMLVLRSLSDRVPMLMDLSKIDLATSTALMWHCGSGPRIYADDRGMTLGEHYKPGSHAPCADGIEVGTVGEMYFRSQEITVARLTWEYERMLAFTGQFIVKQDRSFDGSRGWVGNIMMNRRPVELKDLVNTLLVQRFQHHYPIVSGNVEKELMEVMAWLDIKPLSLVEYQDYLQNPID